MNSRTIATKRSASRPTFGTSRDALPEQQVESRILPLHRIVLYVALPSLLFWTILCLLASGDLRIALLIGSFGLAAGILGWFLRAGRR